MERFIGLLGMVLILGIAFLLSNNRKAINYRTVGVGLLLQWGLAIFILKTTLGKSASCKWPIKVPNLYLVHSSKKT
jgi:concentrative nucleoside transporter, CNT family